MNNNNLDINSLNQELNALTLDFNQYQSSPKPNLKPNLKSNLKPNLKPKKRVSFVNQKLPIPKRNAPPKKKEKDPMVRNEINNKMNAMRFTLVGREIHNKFQTDFNPLIFDRSNQKVIPKQDTVYKRENRGDINDRIRNSSFTHYSITDTSNKAPNLMRRPRQTSQPQEIAQQLNYQQAYKYQYSNPYNTQPNGQNNNQYYQSQPQHRPVQLSQRPHNSVNSPNSPNTPEVGVVVTKPSQGLSEGGTTPLKSYSVL